MYHPQYLLHNQKLLHRRKQKNIIHSQGKKVNKKRSTNKPNVEFADKNFKITMTNMLKKKNIFFFYRNITGDMTGIMRSVNSQ